MKPRSITAVYLAALGVLLVSSGTVLHRFPVMDAIASIDFPYLAVMLGLATLVVGLHCALFACDPSELPVEPILALFLLVAGAANVNIVWDGLAGGFAHEEIWQSLSTLGEFALYSAAFLFLPKWTARATRNEEPDTEAGAPVGPEDDGACR